MGNAVADVVWGKVDPGGRLPQTFPRRLRDNPAYLNYPGEAGRVHYGEGVFIGYRYYDTKGSVRPSPSAVHAEGGRHRLPGGGHGTTVGGGTGCALLCGCRSRTLPPPPTSR